MEKRKRLKKQEKFELALWRVEIVHGEIVYDNNATPELSDLVGTNHGNGNNGNGNNHSTGSTENGNRSLLQ